jgi:BASS family bile acid:Na+ symporter
MEVLATLIPIILTTSLAALIVAVGMDADPGDLLYLFRRPAKLAKAVLAVNVVVPIAAALLVFAFPLTQVARVGILLMAVSPVPPLVPGKELKIGGGKSYSYGLYVTLALLSVIIVPLTVEILSRFYGANVRLPVALIARNVALSVILPLVIGLAVRRLAPAFAERAAPLVRKIAMLLLLLALIPLLIKVWPGVATLIGNGTILAMVLTAVIALAAGHLLGGPELTDRAALAMTAATRHPGIAMMIANVNQADKHVTAAVLAIMLVGLVVGVPYQIWIKRRSRGGAPAATAHG